MFSFLANLECIKGDSECSIGSPKTPNLYFLDIPISINPMELKDLILGSAAIFNSMKGEKVILGGAYEVIGEGNILI